MNWRIVCRQSLDKPVAVHRGDERRQHPQGYALTNLVNEVVINLLTLLQKGT